MPDYPLSSNLKMSEANLHKIKPSSSLVYSYAMGHRGMGTIHQFSIFFSPTCRASSCV